MAIGWGVFQGSDSRSQSQAENQGIQARRSQRQTEKLEEKIDALSMVCQAMWELLHDKMGVTDEQLEQKVEEIDLRDGKLDNQFANDEAVNCSKCSRVLHKRHSQCFYCGTERETEGVFPAG